MFCARRARYFWPLPLTLSTVEMESLYGGAMRGAIRALPVADAAGKMAQRCQWQI